MSIIELIKLITYAKNKKEIIHILNKNRISINKSKYC